MSTFSQECHNFYENCSFYPPPTPPTLTASSAMRKQKRKKADARGAGCSIYAESGVRLNPVFPIVGRASLSYLLGL